MVLTLNTVTKMCFEIDTNTYIPAKRMFHTEFRFAVTLTHSCKAAP
jgi:hypothetical protein